MPLTLVRKVVNRSLTTLLCLTLAYSGAALGFNELAVQIAQATKNALKGPPRQFSEQPGAVYRGGNPSRDATRGGVWSAQNLLDVQTEGLLAAVEPAAQVSGHPTPVQVNPGDIYPWEGGMGGGTGGGMGNGGMGGGGMGGNSGNGNALTKIKLVGWKDRGGMPIEFALYHNSETTYNVELGHNWTWSYDIYINVSGSTATVHWGDGLSVPFTDSGSGGIYNPPAGIYDGLVKNADTTWTLTTKHQVKYQFTIKGFCNAIQDRNGNQITLTLNTLNYCTKITAPSGKYITISNFLGHFFTGITDPAGRSWTFTKDSNSDLTTVNYPVLDGNYYTDQFAYSSSHCITSHTDRRGKVWAATYNTDGSIASVTNPLSHAWSYGYSSSATTETDPLSHATTWNYSSGALASVQDPASYSYSFTRDTNFNPLTVTDKRGKVWTYTYDSRGNILTAKNPLNKTTTYTYSTANDLLSATDPLSHAYTLTYDSYGNMLTVTDPLSHAAVTNTYDAYGNLATTKDALNHTTTLTFDTDHRYPTTVADPLSHSSTLAFDVLGRLTSATDPLSHATSVTYDNWERPVTITHPDTKTITIAYDPNGHATSATDEKSHATTLAYDDAGRVTSSTNAKSESQSFGYDNANRVTTVTNGRGKVRTYTYTARGEPYTLTLADSSVQTWTYNANGQLATYTNPRSEGISYAYDDAGRHTGTTYPAGTGVTLNFDDAGRATSVVDASGTSSWTYDNGSRVTELDTPEGNITCTYDNADRPATMVDGSGTTTYTFDGASRLTSLANPFSETSSLTYDIADRLTQKTLPGGAYDSYGYDTRDRLTSLSHYKSGGTLISAETYAFDDASNMTSKTVGSLTTTYTYDNINQLLSEGYTGYACSYTYDANGNRATRTLNSSTETYTCDDADKLTGITGGANPRTFSYDLCGRRTGVTAGGNTTSYAYDYEDRLTGITYPSTATNSFGYNSFDARVSKTDSGGTSTFRRAGVSATAPVLNDGSAAYTPGISERRSSTSKFYQQDYLGTNTGEIDSSGTTTASRAYDAYGQLVSSSGTSSSPFGYVGGWSYQQDPDSGLKLLGHRYYDASSGRFLTNDRAKLGRNWYGYCGNNPLVLVDANGLGWRRVVGGIAGGILGGILTGGNPLGIAAGATFGSTLGDAGDQAGGGNDVDWGSAGTHGIEDGLTTFVGGRMISFVAEGMGGAFSGVGEATGVVANQIQGKAAEEFVLQDLIQSGADARPFKGSIDCGGLGRRFPDIGIFKDGRLFSLVEVKSGDAVYGGIQAGKDAYIEKVFGWVTRLERVDIY